MGEWRGVVGAVVVMVVVGVVEGVVSVFHLFALFFFNIRH